MTTRSECPLVLSIGFCRKRVGSRVPAPFVLGAYEVIHRYWDRYRYDLCFRIWKSEDEPISPRDIMMDAFLKRGKIPRSDRTPVSNKENLLPTTAEPPAKRLKQENHELDPDEDVDDQSFGVYSGKPAEGIQGDDTLASGVDVEPSDDELPASRPTAIENSSPAIKSDKEALEEYEAYKSSQSSDDKNTAESVQSRLDSRTWVRGKTSIYVDAFNLALHTVLDEESHLFDEKEHAIFGQWNTLGYEAQFLYVPSPRLSY